MSIWSKEIFGHNNKCKEESVSKVSEVDKRDDKNEIEEEEDKLGRKQLFVKLKKIVYKIEVVLNQKSRYKWLEAGDLNSKYLHRQIQWRRLNNMITNVKIENKWCRPRKFKKEVKTFFEKIFKQRLNNDNLECITERTVNPFLLHFQNTKLKQ